MRSYRLDQVRITEPAFVEAWEADLGFMKKLDPDRLLGGFRRSAGLWDMGKDPYSGWEDSRIGGHTMGHYLVACAQQVATDHDTELESRIDYLIEELGKCQEAHGNGYLFGAKLDPGEDPERQFDIEEGSIPGEGDMPTWVPWYTMHKIFDGLLAVHRLCDNKQALEIAERLGDWVIARSDRWTVKQRQLILSKEYGGMNDCLYMLYHQSGQERYKKVAEIFDDTDLMAQMTSDTPDTLSGYHANTTIPKFMGAMEEYPAWADSFWDRVVEHHTYATGGISDMEHFHEDDMLDARRTQCNCEGCCAHNMLKLTHRLYERNPQNKYPDYTERLLFNAILGAIDPAKGTMAYFSPMATGYRKTYGDADLEKNKFWCCTGTGMENYTKLQEEIYYRHQDNIYINQYISSELMDGDRCIAMEVVCKDRMDISITYKGCDDRFAIILHIPGWAEDTSVYGDCSDADITQGQGHIRFEHCWRKGDCIHILYDLRVRAEALKDDEHAVCFLYGPYVLAAKLGRKHWGEETSAGIDVVADAWKVVGDEEAKLMIEYGQTNREVLESETLTRINKEESLEDFLTHIDDHMIRLPGQELQFELRDTDASEVIGAPLIFVPYYTITDERYGIYWYVR